MPTFPLTTITVRPSSQTLTMICPSSQYSTPAEHIDVGLSCVNMQDQFVEHLIRGLFCAEEEHNAVLQDHKTKQGKIGRPHDTECQGLEYLHDLNHPVLSFNKHIPNVLSQPSVYRGSVVRWKDQAPGG
jgi:hypothetical protein